MFKPTILSRHATLAVLTVAIAFACAKPQIKHAGYQVHGAILFEAQRAQQVTTGNDGQDDREASTGSAFRRTGAMVLLPDIDVSLHDINSNAVLDTVTTDLSGHFRLPEHKPGKYKLCWTGNGWFADCLPQPVEVTNTDLYVEPIRISPDKQPNTHPVVGNIRFQDRSLCRFLDIKRQIDITARLETTSGMTARANSAGDYALPLVPNVGTTIKADCPDENQVQIKNKIADWQNNAAPDTTLVTGDIGTVFGGVLTSTSLGSPGTNQPQLLSITLPDRSPAMASFNVSLAGQLIDRAAPGSTVQVTATALDPGPRVRLWRVSAGKIGAQSDSTIDWELPAEVGQVHLELITANGRGGWSRETKVLDITPDTSLVFSGDVQIAGTTTPPPAFQATVNGKPLATSGGHFFGRISASPEARYVLNISAEGFVPVSRIYHRESTGGFYQLQPAVQLSIPASRSDDISFDTQQDRRVAISIPPGTLRKNGAAFNGQIEASFGYLDPSVVALPGDYDALSSQGRDQALISYGALYVDLRDGTGTELELGAPAVVTLPIPADKNLAQAPPQIAVWSYNDQTGFWEEEGMAQLVGDSYRAQVQHFSTINMDIGTEGNAVCARVQLDFQKTPDNPILKASLTLPGGGTQVKQATLDQKLNAVFRLIPNQDVTFQLLHSDGSVFDDFVLLDAGSAAAIPNGTVSLSNSDLMQGVDLWPDEPYLDCVPFVIASGDVPASGDMLAKKGAPNLGDEGKSLAYYKLLDPNDQRTTLEDWLTHNGFQPIAQPGGGFLFQPAAQVLSVAYLNHGDLGSGRKMHCRSEGPANNLSKVACVVGNYATAPTDNFNRDPAGADVAGAANSGTGFATVAMEYSTVEGFAGVGKLVKFFTYGGNNRITLAQLDRVSGDRLQPQVCMVCHGGNLPINYEVSGATQSFPTSVAAVNALDNANKTAILEEIQSKPSSFREFDIPNLRNLQGSNPESKMRALNCNYVRQTDPNGEIDDIIAAWYGANCTSSGSATQNLYQPWGAQEPAFYESVVARSCRTCHIAQSGLEFNTKATFDAFNGGGAPYTCGKTMPQADITYNAHWVNKLQDQMEALYGNCP